MSQADRVVFLIEFMGLMTVKPDAVKSGLRADQVKILWGNTAADKLNLLY
tara:strand:- start:805 stop:954 length:150 start_codon:yes stop_codon:yes gene_type:complete